METQDKQNICIPSAINGIQGTQQVDKENNRTAMQENDLAHISLHFHEGYKHRNHKPCMYICVDAGMHACY